VGERLIFREGRTKGLGVITKIVTVVENKKKNKIENKIEKDNSKIEVNNDKEISPSILDTKFKL
jgi:hypothetical protein